MTITYYSTTHYPSTYIQSLERPSDSAKLHRRTKPLTWTVYHDHLLPRYIRATVVQKIEAALWRKICGVKRRHAGICQRRGLDLLRNGVGGYRNAVDIPLGRGWSGSLEVSAGEMNLV